MLENINQASFTLKGTNHLRYLFIFMLTGVILVGIYFIPLIGYLMLIIILAALIGLLSIRFPYLYIFADNFVIEKKGIHKKFTHRETISYGEIENIEFVKARINWSQLVIQSISGQGAYGGFSKSDHLMLKLKNGSTRILYRFGSRNDFMEVIRRLKEKIDPTTNN